MATTRHPLYRAWDNMRQRCKNNNHTSYRWYGDRNIKVCEEWDMSFEEFYEWSLSNGWREKLTLDRIDSSQDYCPINCQWISKSTNSRKSAILPRSPKRSQLTSIQLEEIKSLINNETSNREIEKKFNLRIHELSRIMKTESWHIINNSSSAPQRADVLDRGRPCSV